MIMNKLKEIIILFIQKRNLASNPILAKYQDFILPLASILFTFLILILITIPQLSTLLETYKTLTEVNTKQDEEKGKLARLETINQKVYKDNLNIALIALPAEKDIPGIIDQILIMLSGSGMHLSGINFSNTPDNSSNIPNLQVRLDITGDDEQLRSFLSKAKSSPRVIKINSIQYGKTLQDNKIQASLNILAFYQELPANIASNIPTVPLLSEEDNKLLLEIKQKQVSIPVLSELDSSKVKTGKDDPFQ